MTFISEDKKTINLPIPLGTTVYRFITDCNNACTFQKEKFDEAFPETKNSRCNSKMPCHTSLHSIQPVILNLSNLDWVLNDWQINFFETEAEAREAGSKLVKEHRKQLLDMGLEI
jgi:hypothetical protein